MISEDQKGATLLSGWETLSATTTPTILSGIILVTSSCK